MPPHDAKINSTTTRSISATVTFDHAELRRIKIHFRHSLPTDAARTLVNSLSRIDYCNCLLAGTPVNLTDMLLLSVMNVYSSQDCMRSQKIRPHHKSHERLATLATRPATVDVQVMSTRIQISPRLCTRLFDGTLHSGCTIGIESPLAISCSRRSHHPANNNIVRRPRLRTCWTTSME